MKKSILILAAAATLAGCVSPTPYEPKTERFGYTDQKLETDRYRVEFSGNSDTQRGVVENYLLYRAAQVTVDTGHDYFVVTDHDTDKNVAYIGDAETGFGFNGGPANGFGGFGYPGWYGGGGTTLIDEQPYDFYTADAVIQVFSGGKPRDNPHAYDARDVLVTLGPVIQTPLKRQ